MKKNKENRKLSRVLSRLVWANFYHVNDENENAYKEVLAAKRCIEECGGDNVEVVFYDREYHITFEVYRTGHECNRYYTVSASHGYTNDYHNTNKSHVNHLIATAEVVRDCALRREYSDYLAFQQRAGNVLYWALDKEENHDYWYKGDIHDIPYDVSIRLWRDLRECVFHIIDEAVAHKKVVL